MRTPTAAALPSSVSGLTRRPAAAAAPGPQPRAAPRPGDDPTRDLLARLPAGDALRRIIEALDQQGVLALAAKLFGAAAGPSLRPVKDIQNQERRADTFSLMANEPRMVWQSNAHLYILTGVQYPMVVTRLSGSWNAICRAEAGPPRPGL